jgi:hypothetical protein
MNEATLRGSIRTLLIGAAAMTASIGWAQQQEPAPPTTSTPTEPATTEAPATTDSTSPSAATPQSPSTGAALDEKKIDQFADAYVAVQKIQQNAAAELDSAASDPAKQQQAQAKVENEMIAAVERTGLKLEEFNGIVQTMSADADLRARVVAKIRERMGG